MSKEWAIRGARHPPLHQPRLLLLLPSNVHEAAALCLAGSRVAAALATPWVLHVAREALEHGDASLAAAALAPLAQSLCACAAPARAITACASCTSLVLAGHAVSWVWCGGCGGRGECCGRGERGGCNGCGGCGGRGKCSGLGVRVRVRAARTSVPGSRDPRLPYPSRPLPRPALVLVPRRAFSCGGAGAAWSQRLVTSEHASASLASAAALVSTLGGGHFLCKHIGASIALARAQMRLAAALGDAPAWRRCHVHLLYIAVQCGQWRAARALLRRVRGLGVAARDEGLLAMARAAGLYLRRTRALGDAVRPAGGGGRALGGDAAASTVIDAPAPDPLYRQRLVEYNAPVVDSRWLEARGCRK